MPEREADRDDDTGPGLRGAPHLGAAVFAVLAVLSGHGRWRVVVAPGATGRYTDVTRHRV